MRQNGQYIEYSICELDELRHRQRMAAVEAELKRGYETTVSEQTSRVAKLVLAKFPKHVLPLFAQDRMNVVL